MIDDGDVGRLKGVNSDGKGVWALGIASTCVDKVTRERISGFGGFEGRWS